MKNCIICNEDGKYKCPTCLIYYCSVTCCKKHRENKCDVVKKEEPMLQPVPQSSEIRYPTVDTVPLEKLKLLQRDKTLKQILENPHLRDLLQTIDKAENADVEMQKAMLEPLFVEFADACLNVVEPKSDDET
ncbi:HIT zinc finger [Popillia japonica]|uniref:HIT zinc finger n=1 Tax=Popillia japonica TaxID=7064 RepID=A0AAW1K0B3_POPJA